MPETISIQRLPFGFYLILGGIILFLLGVLAENYEVYSHTPEGYLSGVSHPFHLAAVVLIVVSCLLFLIGFYSLVKGNIKK